MKNAMQKLAAAAVFLLCAAILLSGPYALVRSFQGHASSHVVFGATNTESGTATHRLDQHNLPTADIPFNNRKATGLANGTASGDAISLAQAPLVARFVTTAALPAYTYSNGSSGVGATITVNANGVCPTATFDGGTVAVGDVVLVQNGAAASDNWLYSVTAPLGDGSNPCKLTRVDYADSAAEIAGSQVRIREGNSRAGTIYTYINTGAITVGTTGLFAFAYGTTNPSEIYTFTEEFDWIVATAGAKNGTGPMTPIITGTGAAATVPTNANSATAIGVVQCAMGTTATSRCAISASPTGSYTEVGSVIVAAANGAYVDTRLQVSALSDATDTYSLWFGLTDSIATLPPNNVLGGLYQQSGTGSDTHWQLFACNAGTCTKTPSANTVTAATYVRFIGKKDAGDSTWYACFDNVCASTGSNLPLGNAVAPMIAGLRSAGTTNNRNWKVDWFKFIYTVPNGRAL